MGKLTTNSTKSFVVKWVAPAVVLLALAVVGVVGSSRLKSSTVTASAAAGPTQAEVMAIEDRWGIQVTQIVLAADGGLVDLRYRVVDQNKALNLFDDVENVPKLIAKDGTRIELITVPHRHDLEFGQTYFIIYRNVANAIKPGEKVTIAVSDLSLHNFGILQ
jgi:hypothetical protein